MLTEALSPTRQEPCAGYSGAPIRPASKNGDFARAADNISLPAQSWGRQSGTKRHVPAQISNRLVGTALHAFLDENESSKAALNSRGRS